MQLACSLFANDLVFYRSYYRFFHDRDVSEYLNTFITSQINFPLISFQQVNAEFKENLNFFLNFRLNAARPRTSSLVSTLDAVSSASGHGVNDLPNNHNHMNGDDAASSTSTDESGNDSFTCSEIE